jgi:hypothetical protein
MADDCAVSRTSHDSSRCVIEWRIPWPRRYRYYYTITRIRTENRRGLTSPLSRTSHRTSTKYPSPIHTPGTGACGDSRRSVGSNWSRARRAACRRRNGIRSGRRSPTETATNWEPASLQLRVRQPRATSRRRQRQRSGPVSSHDATSRARIQKLACSFQSPVWSAPGSTRIPLRP